MHVSDKKKLRVRNRARNKCNRNEAQQQVEDQQASTSNPETTPESVAIIEEDKDSAICIIQQLLRKKLLTSKKKKAPAAAPNVAPTPAPAATPNVVPPTALAPPISAVHQQDEQSQQMHDLLKCLNSKLQKAGQGASEVPREALLSHLGKMLSTAPLSDAESSDEEAEYVEYIYKPRPYFMTALCNHCKMDLCGRQALPCKDCGLSYYCCMPHMREDHAHRQLCYGLRQLVQQNGHDIFYKSADFDAEQFRSYRIVCIRHLEKLINRPLSATEQELLLFPLICNQNTCREHRFKRLVRCGQCGEVSYCKDQATHLSATHAQWCGAYKLFKALVIFQSKFGRVEPPLPDAVLKDLPMACSNTRQILKKLHFNVSDECEFAALTQISTGPLTVFYALKLCNRLRESELTVHLIGAEMEFEVDVFQKWELFLLHILPPVQTLNVVFVGPELNPNNINFEQLKKIRCCRLCRKAQRTVQYYFENRLYHDYCKDSKFIHPDLVCFFNSGLYRSTGFALEDTWPDTIRASLDLKCPIVVTSYTKYEAPLDMSQFINESNRHLNVALPPTTNPFASEKPERNFISDHDAPFMFKNYQCFVIE